MIRIFETEKGLEIKFDACIMDYDTTMHIIEQLPNRTIKVIDASKVIDADAAFIGWIMNAENNGAKVYRSEKIEQRQKGR